MLTSFVEGGIVMAIEILGAKMIAPFFGTSLYVWSATLAITLFGLTLGYFIGGLLSAKKNTSIIFYVLAAASILIGAMNILSFWILTETISFDIKIGSIVSLIVYLLPPLCLLGMTSPLIINELSDYFKNPGKSAGIVYAISTTGGILMTFIVGFILIPNIGVRKTCFYYALFLSLFPIFYFLAKKNKKGMVFSILTLIMVIIINIKSIFPDYSTSVGSRFDVKYKSEGLLGSLTVIDLNKNLRFLNINNTSQTLMHIPSKKAVWKYVHRISTYSSLKPKKSSVLVCGLGGGMIVNEMLDLGFNVDVCEIDARTEFVAKKYFYLKDGYNISIDDARHFIKKSTKKYDIIILDLSIAETVPTNVYTLESFNEIKNILNKDGFVFLHYLNNKHGEGAEAVKAIGNTLTNVGFDTHLLNTTHTLKNSNELVYFSTLNKIDLTSFTYNRLPNPYEFVKDIPKTSDVYDNYSFSGGILLTDDKPNIDILHQTAALHNRTTENKERSKKSIRETEILYH